MADYRKQKRKERKELVWRQSKLLRKEELIVKCAMEQVCFKRRECPILNVLRGVLKNVPQAKRTVSRQ